MGLIIVSGSSTPLLTDPIDDMLYWYRHREDLGTHIVTAWQIGQIDDVVKWASERGYIEITYESEDGYYVSFTELIRQASRLLELLGVPEIPPSRFSGKTAFGKI